MREQLIPIGTLALVLTSCSPEPVTIPDDLSEAAQFCVAAKGLTLRDAPGRRRGDPMTISMAAQMQAYPLIAASKNEDFEIDFDGSPLVDTDKVGKYGKLIAAQDYKKIASDCDNHFGIVGELSLPTLPADDIDALRSCVVSAQWMEGILSFGPVDDEGKRTQYNELKENLEDKLRTAIAGAQPLDEGRDQKEGSDLLRAARQAYSHGNVINYLAACDARFTERRT